MFSSEIQSLDENILLKIQRMRFQPLTFALKVLTWTGAGRVWITVALLCNLLNRSLPSFHPYFLNAFFSPLFVWAINWVVKRKVKRDRPNIANQAIVPLVKTPPCFSFPSSHAGSTFAFAFVLLWWQFPEAKFFFIWATIVAFSRMYLGVHYLTDIIAGILVGLMASGLAYLIF